MDDGPRVEKTPRQRFWELVCDVRVPLQLSLFLAVIFLTLTAIGLFYAPPGSGAEVIGALTLAMLLGFLAVVLYVLRRCSQPAEDRQ